MSENPLQSGIMVSSTNPLSLQQMKCWSVANFHYLVHPHYPSRLCRSLVSVSSSAESLEDLKYRPRQRTIVVVKVSSSLRLRTATSAWTFCLRGTVRVMLEIGFLACADYQHLWCVALDHHSNFLNQREMKIIISRRKH